MERRLWIEGHLVRQKIERTNDYRQAGERYRAFEDWERDELILNLVNTLKPARRHIQERMVQHFTQYDPDYGRRVAEGLGLNVSAGGAESGTGAAGNGRGSTQGTDAAAANEATRSAEEQGHPSQPYYATEASSKAQRSKGSYPSKRSSLARWLLNRNTGAVVGLTHQLRLQ